MNSQMTVSEVIDTQYIDYAMYVLENRAIPCYISGLKPVQNKLLYSMINNYKGRKVKVAELGGGLSSIGYHHGEASAMGAAVNMAAQWNNNVPLFEGHGNFGSRLIQEAAAPRYIFASLNPVVEKYFTDWEVVDKNSDPDSPEPQTYLPLIPWVLVNGVEGIAVGFACSYLPHAPEDLVEAVKLAINGNLSDDHVIPVTFPGFTGEVIQETPTKVSTRGVVKRDKRNQWIISEAPWGFDRERMFKHLEKMMEDGKIQDFDDNCDASGFNFLVKMDTKNDANCQLDPIDFFKLEKSFTENYTALDENGKLKLFESKVEIVKAFVEYRTKKIQDFLDFEANRIQTNIDWWEAKLWFCKEVVNGLDLRGMSRKELGEYIEDQLQTEQFTSRLVAIPVVDLTKDQIEKLEKQIAESKKELAKVKKTQPKKLFLDRLNAL